MGAKVAVVGVPPMLEPDFAAAESAVSYTVIFARPAGLKSSWKPFAWTPLCDQ